jgi:hypothetical protein
MKKRQFRYKKLHKSPPQRYNFKAKIKEKTMRMMGTLPVCFIKEEKSFVAFSPALDLSTCGRTLEESKKNFIEAVGIFFEECTKMGTLQDVLLSCGWVKKPKKGWVPPIYLGEEKIKVPQFAAV